MEEWKVGRQEIDQVRFLPSNLPFFLVVQAISTEAVDEVEARILLYVKLRAQGRQFDEQAVD
jgi:hypothetical protein